MHPENFITEKVQEYFKKAEEFVQDLYDQQHLMGFERNADQTNNTSGGDDDEKKMTRGFSYTHTTIKAEIQEKKTYYINYIIFDGKAFSTYLKHFFQLKI